MQAVMQTKAQAYAPNTPQAIEAVSRYVERANSWSSAYADARRELVSFLKEKVKARALGFVATDALNMSVFGVVFEEAPGSGFIAVPGQVADRVRDQGLRGEAYFPDTKTPLGKQVMEKINAISRVAERRPLLNGVPGVSSFAVENRTVVLTRAVETASGPMIYAAPAALTAQAEVVPFAAPSNGADGEAFKKTDKSRMRM